MDQDETDNLLNMTQDGRQTGGSDSNLLLSCLPSWLAPRSVSPPSSSPVWPVDCKRRAGVRDGRKSWRRLEGGRTPLDGGALCRRSYQSEIKGWALTRLERLSCIHDCKGVKLGLVFLI